MPLHQKAFWTMSAFLGGIISASLLTGGRFIFWQLLSLWILLGAVCLLKKSTAKFAIFALVALAGANYFLWFNGRAELLAQQIEFGDWSGQVLITRVVSDDSAQTVTALILPQQQLKIRLALNQFIDVRYGDVVSASGKLIPPDEEFLAYYRKEGLVASLKSPKIETLTRDQGRAVLAGLEKVRLHIATQFTRVLPPAEATFLTGLTLGKSAGFSKDFKEKLKQTGTTHLVALSGYNVTIIATLIATLSGWIFLRRASFVLSLLTILAFVVMTGAEASVTRAGIMAGIVLIAAQSSRVFSVKNAVAAAAFLMALHNPYVLYFDIGFQLSFAALLGLVYLSPALRSLLHLSPEKGFLSWREQLLTTISAQIAVLPILLSAFGAVSVLATFPNLLILPFVPFAMLFGLIIVLVGLIAQPLALVVGALARIILTYQLSVIEFFSKIPLQFTVEKFSVWLMLIYYAGLIGLIFWAKKYARPIF